MESRLRCCGSRADFPTSDDLEASVSPNFFLYPVCHRGVVELVNENFSNALELSQVCVENYTLEELDSIIEKLRKLLFDAELGNDIATGRLVRLQLDKIYPKRNILLARKLVPDEVFEIPDYL